jgi:putative oxidoreductase
MPLMVSLAWAATNSEIRRNVEDMTFKGLIRAKGRVLMSGIFVVAGWQAFTEPGGRADKAEALGLPEADLLVKVNGLTMMAAGTALGLGIKPKLAALALVGALIPTTLAGHPFWNDTDPVLRNQQLIQVLKNIGLMGGLLLVVAD